MKNLDSILKSFVTKHILVLGDIMLDQYIWGKVERISPEAPVPVLDMQREEYRLGGAANVAMNLRALGSKVSLCGTIGDDAAGLQLKEMLKAQSIDSAAVIKDKSRPTTLKTRIGAVNQQIVRIDRENRLELSPASEKKLIEHITRLLAGVDAVIIEDYNKGLLTAAVIEHTIKTAARLKKLVAVDPKQKNFFLYKQVDVFKPNYSELQKNLGVILESEADFDLQARALKAKLKCKNLVVTRGEKGLYIYAEDGKLHKVPSFAREVYDVSGAGDTVISTLTLALCEGCSIHTAAIIANHAAGIVCGKIGTATVTIEEIRKSWHDHQ